MNEPLISAIIPVYNYERYLGEAVESVLAQNWRRLEIIVVDDGSSDGTAGVARRFGSLLRYDVQSHAGPGAARNRGVELARGDYLAFLDADDLWADDKLALQMAAFDVGSPPDAVFGHVQQFLSLDLPVALARQLKCPAELVPGRIPGTMLISIRSFKRVGPFSTDLRIGEFVEWYSRAAELRLTDVMLPQMVLKRRIHAANSGIVHRASRSDYVRVLKSALDRRRQGVAD
jgi:glycosyltransferase involved in cell wall biosynthesis